MRTTLKIGDWSADGHGRTEDVVIEHNLASTSNLRDAYLKGCDILTVPHPYMSGEILDYVMREVADDYECSSMLPEIAHALKQHGIMPNGPDSWRDENAVELYTEENDDYNVEGYEGFARLWMMIAQLGNPELRFELLNESEDTINVGGYGLFWG